jgi:hypothetical protein
MSGRMRLPNRRFAESHGPTPRSPFGSSPDTSTH